MNIKSANLDKQRRWEKIIHEATRSGMSISQFCRRNNVKEKQFYWWRRRLGQSSARVMRKLARERSQASFALVSDQPSALDAGIELVLGDGRRLRIGKGVDEETLRAVLAAVGSQGC
jgi:transposase-like protein